MGGFLDSQKTVRNGSQEIDSPGGAVMGWSAAVRSILFHPGKERLPFKRKSSFQSFSCASDLWFLHANMI